MGFDLTTWRPSPRGQGRACDSRERPETEPRNKKGEPRGSACRHSLKLSGGGVARASSARKPGVVARQGGRQPTTGGPFSAGRGRATGSTRARARASRRSERCSTSAKACANGVSTSIHIAVPTETAFMARRVRPAPARRQERAALGALGPLQRLHQRLGDLKHAGVQRVIFGQSLEMAGDALAVQETLGATSGKCPRSARCRSRYEHRPRPPQRDGIDGRDQAAGAQRWSPHQHRRSDPWT
jgi:hypothetical protein